MFTNLKFIKWSILVRILIIICFVTIFFGFLLTVIEPENFKNMGDGIWWAFITIATVGYGDLVPKTILGRGLGIILVLIGAGILSAYFASIASATTQAQSATTKGATSIKDKKHMIIVGWNGRAKNVINQLLQLPSIPTIVLIDETLEENPYQHNHVKFLRGQAYSDDILIKANTMHAQFVLITADQNQTEKYADMKSIMTLLAVKGMYPTMYCVVEVLSNAHLSNARRAGADEIIQTNLQTSYAMVNAVLSHGMSNTILTLLDYFQANHLAYITPKEEWVGLSFQELRKKLEENHYILIGLQNNEKKIIINPATPIIIKFNDQLLVISN